MSDLDEHVALRLAAFRRHRPYVESPAAEAAIRTYLTPHHTTGSVRVHRRAGRVSAVAAWRFVPDSWFGAPSWNVAIDHDVDVPADEVEAWLLDTLGPVLPTLDAELDVLVPASYPPVLAALRRLGLGIDSVQLVGEVDRALALLDDAPLPSGLRIAPMREDDLPQVFAMLERTFVEEPEHGWFCALPKFIASQREELETAARDPEALQLVVREGETVVGHVGASIDVANPFWGPATSLGLCFAPPIRGRGVLRPFYRAFLEGLRARGVRVFRGGTSRPAVMHLGRVMDRTLQGVNLRRGAPFPPSHFAATLEAHDVSLAHAALRPVA
ncbi:MAG: hypothetical protein H6721_18120 [Sandaracinus sp.]|nr:hypothetical protein [Myxococcales bacterium]MCB9620279.1 hypothetical protein [Sandaracinus sp.]MCB9634040.1 hypothetical protein [Sandaracinus sp.]